MSEYVSLVHDGVKMETEDAVLFRFSDQDVWIPRSLIDDYDDKDGYVDVVGWFVEQEGLEAYAA